MISRSQEAGASLLTPLPPREHSAPCLRTSGACPTFWKGRNPVNKFPALRKTLLLLPLLALSIVEIDAQSSQTKAPPDELFRTIASLDDALFDSYNRCDLEKFLTFFTDDLEFYHDQS